MRNPRQAASALRSSGCRQDCSGDSHPQEYSCVFHPHNLSCDRNFHHLIMIVIVIAGANKEPSFSVLNPRLTLAAMAAAVLKKRLVWLVTSTKL